VTLLEQAREALGRELLEDEVAAAARLVKQPNALNLLIELCGGRPPELSEKEVRVVGYEPTRVQIVGRKGKVTSVPSVRRIS